MFWMPLQLVMGFRQVGTSIVLGMLLFSLLGASWEEQEPVRRLLSGSEVDGAIEDNLADLLWVNCELELSSLKEAYEDLDVNIQDTSSIPDSNTPKEKASSEENVQRALSFQKVLMVLDPLIRKKLLDCVGEKIGNFPVPGEEVAPTSWYLKHLGSLFSKFYAPTTSIRRLASASGHAFSPAPTPSPEPALRHAQSRSPPLHPLLEADSPVTPFFPSVAPPTNAGSQAKSSDQGSTHRTLIVAVVVSASVTIIVASLTFLCCRFTCCKGSRFKDDKPLLNVNMSDYSVGSSVKSYVRDNSFKKLDTNFSEKNGATSSDGGAISAKANASANNVSQISAGFSGESVNANANVPSLLKPPPGRIGVFPPGMPPLKPPPGRADPLPPERPASMRSMPSRTGPPLPSPVPPPSRPAGAAVPPAPRPPPPPPVPSRSKPSPSPPPPPRAGGPPPPPRAGAGPPRPSGSGAKASSSSSTDDANKAKLKPFFWDKVMANPDHSMVWDQIKSGSFQFNEEMIETLFGYAPVEKNKNEQNRGSNSHNQQSQFIQLIDPKKAQNLSILLRALNVTTEEVIDALKEGKELPSELLETLMRMAPTTDEELKLRLYSGELSQLGPAERFLKVLVDIPFAFKRLESLFFMGTVKEEVTVVRDSFVTLEAACKEVKSSRLFLKLLEAVLKTGNRMNNGTFRGGAQAFKLDTLLKLSDVKGTDGKTTLLHFVVQEIIRSEGLRAVREAKESQSLSSIKSDDLHEDPSVEDAEEHYCSLGLQAVSGLGSQLENVKKAACLDANSLIGTIAKLGSSLVKTKNFLNSEMKGVDMDSGFCKVLKAFVENVESEIIWWLEEEKRIIGMVKKTADYFHGNAGKEEGLRLFVIVRDFLIMLDKVCREVREKAKRTARKEPRKKEAPARRGSSETPRQLPSPNISPKLFPAIMDRRVGDSSSSDDED